jgi:hypothetical protein
VATSCPLERSRSCPAAHVEPAATGVRPALRGGQQRLRSPGRTSGSTVQNRPSPEHRTRGPRAHTPRSRGRRGRGHPGHGRLPGGDVGDRQRGAAPQLLAAAGVGVDQDEPVRPRSHVSKQTLSNFLGSMPDVSATRLRSAGLGSSNSATGWTAAGPAGPATPAAARRTGRSPGSAGSAAAAGACAGPAGRWASARRPHRPTASPVVLGEQRHPDGPVQVVAVGRPSRGRRRSAGCGLAALPGHAVRRGHACRAR